LFPGRRARQVRRMRGGPSPGGAKTGIAMPEEVRCAFTVDVEEYFQVEGFAQVIEKSRWDAYPRRTREQTARVLDLLQRYGVRGTFFILGWVAERDPELVRRIRDSGHEIASHGFGHKMITGMTEDEFRKDIRMAKEVLEAVSGAEVRGYRAPTFSILEKTAWAYDILLHEGYRYSSSVYPVWHDRYGWPGFGDQPRRMASNDTGELWEIPMSVGSVGPLKIPFGGGGYLRSYPLRLTKALFRRLERHGRHSILYIHPWELDTAHPEVEAPFLDRFRHFIGIRTLEAKLEKLLQTRKFGTVSQLLEATLRVKGGAVA
jgi:polysaccharide deacetylase family protein (PEP-CTERM system associated)